MSTKVRLRVVDGPNAGGEFEFGADTAAVFGRDEDCGPTRLAVEDGTLSRHHFLLEATPPTARLRDLGSLTGTYVNGVKYGGRESDESPDTVARRVPTVELQDGDTIRAGQSLLKVAIGGKLVAGEKVATGAALACRLCSAAIAEPARERCGWLPEVYVCGGCRARLAAGTEPDPPTRLPARPSPTPDGRKRMQRQNTPESAASRPRKRRRSPRL